MLIGTSSFGPSAFMAEPGIVRVRASYLTGRQQAPIRAAREADP